MQKIKKLLNVALIIIMVVSMVACGTESADELIALGAQYLLDGNYKEAVVTFDKAIAIDDKNIVAYMGLGDGNLGLEDYDKAGAAYDKAISLNSEYVEGYIGRADTYLFAGDQAAALDILADGYSATSDESLNNIIDEINAGTYEPSILHEDWESIYEEYLNDAVDEEPADDESWHDDVAKAIYYADLKTMDDNGDYMLRKAEYYDTSGKLLEAEFFNSQGGKVAPENIMSGSKQIWYYSGGYGHPTKYEIYRENGNLECVDYYDGDKSTKTEWYDENGNLEGVIYYDENGNPID
jgi:tetratricopeptide (TPR) repeat protein